MRLRLRHQLPATSPFGLGEVRAAFRAAAFGTSRRRREALRCAIAASLDARYAILTDTGTGALILALRAAAPKGGAVALPAYGCYDLATACDGAGVEVILYDVEPDTLGPDLDSLAANLRLGARAVVTAPPYGFTTHAVRVRQLCDEHGVPMIEDIAQCLWAETGAGPAGTLGDFVVLSFGRGKGVTAGRGGALLVRKQTDVRLRGAGEEAAWKEATFLLALWAFGRPALFGIPAAVPALRLGETIYRAPREPGPMSDVGVAVLGSTWVGAVDEVRRRRAHAGRLADLLKACPTVRVCRASDGSVPSYLRLPVIMPPETRGRVENAAARRLGIMPGYPCALADLPGFGERWRHGVESFPGAAGLARGLVTFPTHSRVDETDFGRIREWIEGLPT